MLLNLKKIKKFQIITTLVLSLCSNDGFSDPIVGGSSPILDRKANVAFDQDLLDWISHFEDSRDTLNFSPESTDLFSQKYERDKFYVYFKKIKSDQNLDESYLLNLRKDLDEFKMKEGFYPALAPYIVEEILEKSPKSDGIFQNMIFSNDSHYVKSCPSRRKIKRDMSDRSVVLNGSLEFIDSYLKLLSPIQDEDYSLDVVKSMLDAVPVFSKNKTKDKILSLESKYPELSKIFDFVKNNKDLKYKYNVKRKQHNTDKKFYYFVDYKARSGFCEEALKNLRVVMKKDQKSSTPQIDNVWDSGDEIGSCYRSKGGLSARLNFWKNFSEDMEKVYGYKGWVRSFYTLTKLYWNSDLNSDARKGLQAIMERSEKENDLDFYAKSLILDSYISYNESRYKDAISGFRKFVEKFPTYPEIKEVITTLITSFSEVKDWDNVVLYTKNMIEEEDKKPFEERDVSAAGFSLFWNARAQAELGNLEMAVNNWERVASEYFSTYYGGLGHFMLEQVTGKRYMFNPSVSQKFNENFFTDGFSQKDQIALERAKSLLILGDKKNALCELNQIEVEKNEYQKSAVKALLHYSAGDWLTSIKLYTQIPHNFRTKFPSGMERILFPKRYESIVNNYSSKLNLDKDFIISLIRQESIFNTFAVSQAGAKGLMQLMDKTASLEISAIGSNFVEKKVKKYLVDNRREKKLLFEAESNILLGTHHFYNLFNRYNDMVLTLSAYNAGANVAEKWKNKFQNPDLLCFIERIPYKETKNYVKLILRNYFYYKKWYNQDTSNLFHLEDVVKTMMVLRNKKESFSL
ncbi:MAG: lytic transglycosylase domain-containing protein [Oligoflexales bacterium]|nr:lytic transglycosylase domain-containing protein [Oligoflexales bacterium]